MKKNEIRILTNRKRDLKGELKLTHPLFLQNYYLVNDIKEYLMSLSSYSIVVDIGCGTKPYQEYVKKNSKYIGVDIDSENENVDINSSVYDIDLPEYFADYIVSFQVLEHLEEPGLMLKEANRILKKEGEIYLTFPMSEELHEEPYDFFRYTEHGIKYLLEKNGFKNVVIIRQGTNAANLGRKLSVKLHSRRYLKWAVPVTNYIFFKLENRKGIDVMNYGVKATKV